MNVFKRPMFYAASISCIAAAASLFEFKLSIIIILISTAALILTVAFTKKYVYITVLIFLLLFLSNLIIQFKNIERVGTADNTEIHGTFLAVNDTVEYDSFNLVQLKSLNCNEIPQNVKILAFDYKKSDVKMGDIIDCKLKISTVKRYDKYRTANYADGIYATARLNKITGSGESDFLYKTAGKIRNYVKKTVHSHFGADADGFLIALTLGDKSLLSDEFLQNVKTTGVSHVIAISGMHLSIIMTAVFFVTDRLVYNKYVRCLLTVAVTIIISATCGFGMSVIRAGAMYIIASFAAVFNRESDLLNSLCAAVTAVLIGTPFAIFNISFQMSVLSTLALVWLLPFYYNLLINKLKISSKILTAVLSSVMCSVFAVIMTMPVTIKNFGFVSLISPVTNILIIIPVTLALVFNITAITASAIHAVSFLSYPLSWVAGLFSKITVFTVNTVARLPITVAVMPKSAFWWSVLIIVIIIAYMYFYQFKTKGSENYAGSIRR